LPELLEQRRKDLEDHFAALPRELDRWRELSKTPAYEKHYSQIEALSRQMRALNDKVLRDWNGAADFLSIQRAQRNCGAVHVVWNFFREKLLMRSDPEIGSYLRAADAYVWACYEPVLRARREATPTQPFREPPLVAFSAEFSPWALSRHGSYAPQGDSTGATWGGLFEETLAAMPIAIVGVPWQTAEFLPGLALLAHETGHVVDSDFAMGEVLKPALARATAASDLCEGWSDHWRKEVFADLFACYVAGPSFVWKLADVIPDAPDAVKGRRRPTDTGTGARRWGLYPPPTLRLLLNLEALRWLKHAEDAKRIKAYWFADYPEHAMGDFIGDLAPVVNAVYEAAALPETLRFSRLDGVARVYSTAVNDGRDLDPTEPFDPRAVVAVAVTVQRDAAAAKKQVATWTRLQKYIVTARPGGRLVGETRAAAEPWLRTEQLAKTLFTDGTLEEV